MKTLLTLLICLLSLQTNGTTRGDILKVIENKKVSLFINSAWNDAKEVCDSTGHPMGILLAQAILESDSGTSDLAKSKNNYLGLKNKTGAYSRFRSRKSCFYWWAKTVSTECYDSIPKDSLKLWLYALRACNYHNDDRYSKAIEKIYFKYNLNKLDNLR